MCASSASAQAVLYEHEFGWPETGPMYGMAVANAGDVDADGVADIIVGDDGDSSTGTHAGCVVVFSGRTGALVHEFFGNAPLDDLGWSVAGLGDVDGDGYDDVGASAARMTLLSPIGSYVRLYSGRTGSVLHQVMAPTTAQVTNMGRRIASLGDLDADGVRDFAVSAFGFPSSDAYLFVYSGASANLLWQFSGDLNRLCWTIADPGDINSDGVDDVVIGTPWTYDTAGHDASGIVRALSGVDGSVIWSQQGLLLTGFGLAIASIDDLDTDGRRELAVGEPLIDYANPWTRGGRIHMLSGATGALLSTIDQLPGTSSYGLGVAVDRAGDFDGDGLSDISAAVTGDSRRRGHVCIYSSRNGTLLIDAPVPGELGNQSLVGLGDLNGDGVTDVAARSCRFTPLGTGWMSHPELRVMLLSVLDGEPYCAAKQDSLGCVPMISSSSAASLSVGDNFIVRGSNVLNAKPGVLLWSASPLNTPFAGGTLCVAPASFSIRGPVLDSGGSPPSINDCSGAYAFHFSHALMNSRGLTAGTTLYAQFISRDNGFAPPRNIGLTDALRFTVVP